MTEMKDESLTAILTKAVEPYSSDCEPPSAAVEMMLDAIKSAGYRVVKPDSWTLCADGRFVNKTDNRAEAIRFILEDGEDSGFCEVLEVPRTRSDLIAELESLKEPAA